MEITHNKGGNKMKVQISYFDKRGNQQVTNVERKTYQGLLTKLRMYDVYQILMVSPKLSSNDLVNDLEIGYEQFGSSTNLWWA